MLEFTGGPGQPHPAPGETIRVIRQVDERGVSITGLLLAGFIIGSLGVLNDVTATQA